MKLKRYFLVSIRFAKGCVAIAVALIASGALGSAQTTSSTNGKYKIEETRLGGWFWDQLFEAPAVSADGKHVAYQGRGHCEQDVKMCIFKDGHSIDVGRDPIIYGVFLNPDGSRLGYVSSGAGRKGMVTVVDGQAGSSYFSIQGASFSPDGKHFAYIAEDRRGSLVVVDGKEGRAYDRVVQLGFSPDDEVFYGALRGKKSVFVVGEKEFGQDWDIPFTPIFSLDGKHSAYVGCTAKMKACSVVVDGKTGTSYDGIYQNRVFFSDDGSRIWYGARSNGKWAVVLDGTPGPSFDEVFHSSCHTTLDMGALMLGMLLPTPLAGGELGSALGTACSTVDFEFFSPDSKHTWYRAKKGSDWVAVEDGVEGPPFVNILLNAYSPDSKHLMYTRQPSKQSGTELIEDGSKIAEAQGISYPMFSPDSSRIAYANERYTGKQWLWAMVADANKGNEYRMIEFPAFSPDSKHLAYLAQIALSPMMHTVNATDPGGSWTVVLDQQAGGEYSFVIPWTIKFETDGTLGFLAVRKESHDNGSLFRVRYVPNP
jgi:hypothetical protein